MSNIRQRAAKGLRTGDRFAITRRFTREEIISFARISRDYNPVHCDREYAQIKGFQEPIAHGLLTASLLTEIGGQIGWLATGMSFRFKRPVYAEENLTCDWVITEINEQGRGKAKITVVNDDGITVLEAETTGVLPGEDEQQRLAQMLADGDPTNGVTRQST